MATRGLEQAQERIENLPDGERCLDLSGLRLETEDLENLLAPLAVLPGLAELDISDNRLVFLPQTLGRLSGLTSLRASQNALVRLPMSIGQLARLTQLDLSGNVLTVLPESMRALTAVQSLVLSHNRFDFMPDVAGLMTNLRILDLSANKIWQLPNTIGGLEQLEHFNLDDNQLDVLPNVFSGLRSLQYLGLSNNRFRVRPAELDELPPGVRIGFDGNPANDPVPMYIAPGVVPVWAQPGITPGPDRTEITLHASYFQYYVFDEQDDPGEWPLAHDEAGDGVMAPSRSAIRMVSAVHSGYIRLRVQITDHFPSPEGVASATDLSLPSGVLCITGWEGPVLLRHDFGRPVRVRILLEVCDRDALAEGSGVAEIQRMTIVATSTDRPRWRSELTDQIGESLRVVRDTAGPWQAAQEP